MRKNLVLITILSCVLLTACSKESKVFKSNEKLGEISVENIEKTKDTIGKTSSETISDDSLYSIYKDYEEEILNYTYEDMTHPYLETSIEELPDNNGNFYLLPYEMKNIYYKNITFFAINDSDTIIRTKDAKVVGMKVEYKNGKNIPFESNNAEKVFTLEDGTAKWGETVLASVYDSYSHYAHELNENAFISYYVNNNEQDKSYAYIIEKEYVDYIYPKVEKSSLFEKSLGNSIKESEVKEIYTFNEDAGTQEFKLADKTVTINPTKFYNIEGYYLQMPDGTKYLHNLSFSTENSKYLDLNGFHIGAIISSVEDYETTCMSDIYTQDLVYEDDNFIWYSWILNDSSFTYDYIYIKSLDLMFNVSLESNVDVNSTITEITSVVNAILEGIIVADSSL